MNTMDCKDTKALLSAIIDDELDADRRHAVERHLADCAACRAVIDEAEGLNDLIALDAQHRIDGVSMSPQFEQRVLQRTVYAENARGQRHRWSAWTGWFAAAASLTLAAVIWVGNQHQPGQPGSSVAITGAELTTGGAPTASSGHGQTAARPASYTTGIDLRSQTFDGGLPAEAFRIQRAGLISDVTLPYDPVFDWQQADRSQLVETAPATETVASEPAASTAQPMSRDDADTLYSASMLIQMFEEADLHSFNDVERIRQVIELDELLPRMSEARHRLADADRALIFAAESVLLRIAHGPLDHDDAAALQDAVARMNLAAAIESLSQR